MKHLLFAMVSLASFMSFACNPSEDAQAPACPTDAQTTLLAAFDDYDVVALDATSELFIDLIRNPAFPSKVNDIAIECGNSLYQPTLDAFIRGDDVPIADVQQVWRNTTQPSCGFSTSYEELIMLVRRINQGLAPAEKLRVLASDPPIDWSQIKSPEDLDPFRERDSTIASVMENEVLSKHRKGLMLFGFRHLTHGFGSNAVARYEKKYPGLTWVVVAHHGFTKDNAELETKLGVAPSITPIQGTWLGALDASYFTGQAPGVAGYPGVDAYLYMGPHHLGLNPTISTKALLDEDYMNELRQRAIAIDMPSTSDLHPDAFLKRAAEESVLADDDNGGPSP